MPLEKTTNHSDLLSGKLALDPQIQFRVLQEEAHEEAQEGREALCAPAARARLGREDGQDQVGHDEG